MDLNRLTRDADDLIRKVVSRYNQIYVPAGRISQVELDLMLDDMRKLYDTFKTIGQVNLTLQNTAIKPEVSVSAARFDEPQRSATPLRTEKPSHNPEPVSAAVQPEKEIEASAELINETIVTTDPENDLSFEKNAEFITESEFDTQAVFQNPIPTEPEISDFEKHFKPKTKETNPPIQTEQSHGMLADKFNTGNKSLSETIASSQAQGVAGSRVLFQPISDLTSGIGLNDKFSFISELFGNDAAKYEEAITRINKAVNHDEANWILQKYHSVDWDQKDEMISRLKDFIKRRFI